MEESKKFDQWALVELFGHQRIAGRVSEETIAGFAFVRIDVPEHGENKGFTRYFGPTAIYSINPVSEDVAKRLLDSCRTVPVQQYEISTPRRIEHDVDDDSEDGGEDFQGF